MFYDDSLTVELKMEEELNSLFAGSIENHDFQVYLQPKVGLGKPGLGRGRGPGRWKHPERDHISL